ncbi:MAG: aminopeptidase [Oscillospiraceae bacterium]|nr:aminopeptidase [Oscillospiraceae bacterium]
MKTYDELKYEVKNGFCGINEAEKAEMFAFCDDYKEYLGKGKTERQCCNLSLKLAESAGFVPLSSKTSLVAGDKVYSINRGKGIILAVIGQDGVSAGTNIVGAHIDVPRLDLKPNPLYEDGGFAMFKTHYYGGIKKYQWTAIPLSIHGTVIKADGSSVDISIGEDADDPVFCISDLLPHLAQDQMSKKMSEAIPGEGLNVVIGNIPDEDKDAKERVKYYTLKILHEKYGITETDFISAEIQIVPAFMPRDIGFDRSMLAGFGQDDRVCSFAALRAVMEIENPKRTAICLLVDKEEVGSMGNTGMKSRFFENFIAKLCSLQTENYNDLLTRDALSNSMCLSADVCAAWDPNYPEVKEKRNSAIMNCGFQITKYTGARGKSGASDASAEYVGKVRKIMDDAGVMWQTGLLGKVDLGGGGTIAQYVANLDIDTLDCGVPLLSMHSPYEVAGKVDIYMAYKGYKAFMLT